MPKPDWGNAAGGAATGAGIGSAFGPIGTAVGGLLGGVGGLFGFGKSKKPKMKQQSNLSPQQQQLLNPLIQALSQKGGVNQQGLEQLMELLNYEPEGLEEMQAPALEQFNTQVIPNILERFSGVGARSSSALNQALAQGARGVTTDLAAMRANALQNATQIRQNALSQLLGFNQFATNPNFQQNYMKEGKAGLFEQLAPIAGKIAGSQLGSFGGF